MNTETRRRRGRPPGSRKKELADTGEHVQATSSNETSHVVEAPPASFQRSEPQEAVAPRAKQVRRERRYQATLDGSTDRKLKPRVKLDPDYEYRWVDPQDGRVDDLIAKDWDVVEGQAAVVVSGGQNVLMRKLKDWYRDDTAVKQARQDELMEQIKRGEPAQQDRTSAGDPAIYSSDPKSTLRGPSFDPPPGFEV